MRPTLSSTISVFSLSLLTLLSACGGGGDSGDKIAPSPVGQVTLTGTAAGTYLLNRPEPTLQSGTDVTVQLRDAGTSYLAFIYDQNTGAVGVMEAEINISGTQYRFECGGASSPACGASGTAAVNTTARTLTFTNYSLPSDPVGTTTVISGTVTWPAP